MLAVFVFFFLTPNVFLFLSFLKSNFLFIATKSFFDLL